MNKPTRPPRSYFASCSKGLEEVLEKELLSFGITQTNLTQGGIQFRCDLPQVCSALLNSRVASRIYKSLYKFSIETENDLYQLSSQIYWDNVFDIDQTFKLKVIQSSNPTNKKRSRFKNSLFLTYKVKDAIVDTFKKRTRKRPNIDTKSADISFLIHVSPEDHKDAEKVEILIDLSGFPLFKRGYRTQDFPAPLKETLASGLIQLTNWDHKKPLVDLMAGSGTFVLEAFQQAAKLAPTFFSSTRAKWSILEQKWFQQEENSLEAWKQAQTLVKKSEESLEIAPLKSRPQIYASDISRESYNVITYHQEQIPYCELLEHRQIDALKATPPCEEAGVLIMNPPYGDRLGDKDDLKTFYKELGDNLKQNWKGWTVYLLIGDLELVKFVGLRSSKKHIVFNGPIECRFVKYELF